MARRGISNVLQVLLAKYQRCKDSQPAGRGLARLAGIDHATVQVIAPAALRGSWWMR